MASRGINLLVDAFISKALKGSYDRDQSTVGGAIDSLYIAYSGGQDSQVLLHVMAAWQNNNNIPLTALHVNYGLSPQADAWQVFCKEQCAALNIPLETLRVELGKGNTEQLARDARYDWFASKLGARSALLTAHHQADQAETVIQRLMRGSGVKGLSAMPVSRDLGHNLDDKVDDKMDNGLLLRPFLSLSKQAICEYADLHQLSFIEDESNLDASFDRNFIRHEILPTLHKRWPQAAKQISRSAQHCGEADLLLGDLAKIDQLACQASKPLGEMTQLFAKRQPLALRKFTALSRQRQRNCLQAMIAKIVSAPIASAQMQEWLDQVNASYHDENHQGAHNEWQLAGLTLAIYAGQMHFLRPMPDFSQQAFSWQINQPLPIEGLGCQLIMLADKKNISGMTRQIHPQQSLRVFWRQGGERVKLKNEDMTRSLKKMMQNKRLPPWLREGLPLIALGDEIVWSAALGDFTPRLIDEAGNSLSFSLQKT